MHTTPVPLASGERIRNFNLIRLLAGAGWEVHIFALASPPSPADEELGALREMCETVEIAAQPPAWLRKLRAAADVGRRRAFQARYFVSPRAVKRVRALCSRQPVSVIVCSHLYMAEYVPTHLWRQTVFDSVNVEASRLATLTGAGGLRGAAARRQVGPARHYERKVSEAAALVLAVSSADADYFARLGRMRRIEIVPNGIDTSRWKPRPNQPGSREVLFVGSLDYGANVDAALRLIEDILPRLEQPPRLTVVGVNPPRRLRDAAARADYPVEVAGFVPDVAPYFERSRLLAVPLRSGGGTRLKILEALARSVPVVTTSVGCEGLSVVHGRDVLVADDPGSFAQAVARLLEDDILAARLAAAGRATAEEYDWKKIGPVFVGALEQISSSGGFDVSASHQTD